MVDILMATYNGEKYLKDQIDSILNQTYTDWKLYIRDDGSNDNTLNIINEYIEKYRSKIILIEDDKSGLGAKLNFGELLKYSTSEYCMFSDQDDIWLENKIELTLNEMKKTESNNNLPILIHTDLKVVDNEMNIISDSFFKYQNISPEYNKLNNLLVLNTVTGCTVMMNKKLVDLCRSIPKDCILHDWWIALVASGLGVVRTLYEPTILYRQHGDNCAGAIEYKKGISIRNISQKLKENKYKKQINELLLQAQSFNNFYGDKLSIEDQYRIQKFLNLKNQFILNRKISIIKNQFNTGKLKKYDVILLLFI
ncbi:family 2 glycosyl transferase [[Clostridium] sordellii]|uniref:glycosyltransferase family 2 protein n=1 Tax=Paraclostridium sordellii TaxID=1505 RepID=UPI0005E00767|nr:glycosyltransferase family 2 protein [Paeniclostridium sordellii]CEQ10467.1 family 2 glycosyl transferase [[Clostridium] sordellii] [Paeniclostridium sordellii]